MSARYIVLGAGAIGSTLGGHLHRVGREVALIARPDHVAAINGGGLRLVTGDQTHVLDVPAFTAVADLAPLQPDDVVLLTAKAQHTAVSLGQLRAAGAGDELPVVCCQNSIWNEPYATRVFPRVYGAVVFVPGTYLEPGEVINPRVGHYGYIEVGRFPRGRDQLCQQLAADLAAAGFATASSDHVMLAKGAKCLGNLGNALQAATGGEGDGSAYLDRARDEARAVWRQAGIAFEEMDSFDRRRANVYHGEGKLPESHRGTGRRGGSSWQSLARGAGSIESEQLNGDVVQLGRMVGVAAPYNEVLWRRAEELAQAKQPPGQFTVAQLTTEAEREIDNNAS